MDRPREASEDVERYDVLVLVQRYSPNSADALSDEIREWLELGGSLADAQRALAAPSEAHDIVELAQLLIERGKRDMSGFAR